MWDERQLRSQVTICRDSGFQRLTASLAYPVMRSLQCYSQCFPYKVLQSILLEHRNTNHSVLLQSLNESADRKGEFVKKEFFSRIKKKIQGIWELEENIIL